MRYDNKTFFQETVEIDGNEYHGCTFSRSRLVYRGGPPVKMVECLIQDARWDLEGAAANTMRFLSDVYRFMGDEGVQMVESYFTNVRLGKFIIKDEE
jgi:hypothetical protein